MKINIVFILLIVSLLLISCRQAVSVKGDLQQRLDEAKASAVEALKNNLSSVIARNVTVQEETPVQVVYLPQPQEVSNNIINRNYVAPCALRNYKVLNIYCSFKNFWHNQATLLSWHISYAIILFLLFIAIIAIWWLSRRG